MTTAKICIKCKENKLIDQFSKHPDTRDKLDQRCKLCVKLVKLNHNRPMKPRELDIRETDVTSTSWQGGKKKGSILNKGNGLFIATVANKAAKSFRLVNFHEDESKLREEAIRFLYSKSLQLGLMTNQYKILFHKETGAPQYLLVQLSKNFVTLCDYDHLDLVKSHHMFVTISGNTNKHRSHYAAFLRNNHNILFHKDITGFSMTDHINRYPMDNRRCNLRQVEPMENNKNKTNYHISVDEVESGVDFNVQNESWSGFVKREDGTIVLKSFCVAEHGYQEAKNKCIEWRRMNLTNGTGVTFSKRDHAFRSRIKIDKKEFQKLFSVQKYGFDEAKRMAMEWRRNMAQDTANYVSKPGELTVHCHPEYHQLKAEFEDIMVEHAGGFLWKG